MSSNNQARVLIPGLMFICVLGAFQPRLQGAVQEPRPDTEDATQNPAPGRTTFLSTRAPLSSVPKFLQNMRQGMGFSVGVLSAYTGGGASMLLTTRRLPYHSMKQ